MAKSDWVRFEAPAWLWGRNPAGLFESAGLQVKKEPDGTFLARTEEAYYHRTANLITTTTLHGPGKPDHLARLSTASERAAFDFNYARMQAELDEIAEKGVRSGEYVHLLNHIQGLLSVTPPQDLAENASEALEQMRAIRYADRPKEAPGPFSGVGLMTLTPSADLVTRYKLPSVFLRLQADERLREGDTSHLGDFAFSSSHALYDGIYLMDPYIGPLRGCASPAMWCLASPRTFGTLLLPLGRAVAGTTRFVSEPLDLVQIRSPRSGHDSPYQTFVQQVAAVDWWGAALNSLFATISDPAVFQNAHGIYSPSAQLDAILTVEQLFRRVTSLLVEHRDVVAQQVLMFSCIDTIEALSGISPHRQATESHARDRLRAIAASMPADAQPVLLPMAERAIAALGSLQDGFELAHQNGLDHITWGRKSASLEGAAAYYFVGLRNATHGHGGGSSDERQRRAALLVQHNGDLPDDLAKLAYLYLIELLSDPGRLRRILSARSSRTR